MHIDTDAKRVIATTGLLKAAAYFNFQRDDSNKPFPSLTFRSLHLPGKKPGDASAEYEYYAKAMHDALTDAMKQWNDILQATKGNSDQMGMLGAFLSQPQWEEKIEAIYEPSSRLRAILRDGAKVSKPVSEIHLKALNRFRALAEDYLVIQKDRELC